LQCHYFQRLGFNHIALLGPSIGGSKYFEHKLLQYTRWHRGKACDILGISRPSLERRIKKYAFDES